MLAATSAVFLALASVYAIAFYDEDLTRLIALPAIFFVLMTLFNAAT